MLSKTGIYYPGDGTCLWCRKPKGFPEEFVTLNAGAYLDPNRRRPKHMAELLAFLDLTWMGAEPLAKKTRKGIQFLQKSGPQVHLDVVDGDVGGQFDFSFCTTQCLRRFLNACVDELEHMRSIELAKAKRHNLYRFGRAKRDRKSYLVLRPDQKKLAPRSPRKSKKRR